VRVTAEFTIEPFEDGNPGRHVTAGIDAMTAAGLAVEVGPFGSSTTGEAGAVAAGLSEMVQAATAAGAERISLQVTIVEH
jgi:uncharacterized protein YqgV (UPF0045/DUF77 family)